MSRWKACPVCHLPKLENSFVCRKCLQPLGHPELHVRRRDKIRIYSLYRWERRNHELLSRLIYSLKGGDSLKAHKFFLTKTFLLQLKLEVRKLDQFVIVPSPPKDSEFDHAVAWAEALSSITGLGVRNILERTDKHTQKLLSKKQRLGRKVGLKNGVKPPSKVLFVDDVVTTGATLKAAFEALNQPARFEVFCFAERPLEDACHPESTWV